MTRNFSLKTKCGSKAKKICEQRCSLLVKDLNKCIKSTVMQIAEALINDSLCVSKVF